MDWQKIKKESPKAFERFHHGRDYLIINDEKGGELGHYFTDGVHTVQMWSAFPIRNLYDFFDEQGYFISVIRSKKEFMGFYAVIKGEKGNTMKELKYVPSRKEAEEVIFDACFFYLENRINHYQHA